MNRGRYPQSSVENPAARATIDQDRDPANPVEPRSVAESERVRPAQLGVRKHTGRGAGVRRRGGC